VKARPPLPAGPYLVVGLARSGRAAALALRSRGEEVIGTDAGHPLSAHELSAAGVRVSLGADGIGLLEHARAVIKSPGVPADAPVISAARARGLPVLGELELGWRMLPRETIAVTGTNGKTTTSELIGHLHRKAGIPVAVAGNVGTPLSLLVSVLDRQATVVCETSSFQLEDATCFAPEAAVLLNLSPDHLDRHGSFDAYRAAKLRVFANQGEADLAVLPSALEVDLGELGIRAHEVRFGAGASAELREREGRWWWREMRAPLLEEHELSLRGAHNVENAMAAAALCLSRGIDPDLVRAGLRDFAGVSHRLEELERRRGVLYVNDSKATNVASTLVALRALCPPGEGSNAPLVHLILGGQGKGQDFSALRIELSRCARAVYLLGEDAPRIARELGGLAAPVRDCGDLERALSAAASAASPGEVVLLSPGCASFDQFVDFEDRGEHFRQLVADL
jgi:UDP-N-acetylmuramoylalanine--D-glutamate ligase